MVVSYQNREASFDPKTLAFGPLAATHKSGSIGDLALDPSSIQLTSTEPPSFKPHVSPAARPWQRGRWLDRLVLNVANYCNLDCVYCYAQGGRLRRPAREDEL
jgi:sulfatase maturation enzyme AslB (radical SAM superfamily)